jgi:hypothetical protein
VQSPMPLPSRPRARIPTPAPRQGQAGLCPKERRDKWWRSARASIAARSVGPPAPVATAITARARRSDPRSPRISGCGAMAATPASRKRSTKECRSPNNIAAPCPQWAARSSPLTRCPRSPRTSTASATRRQGIHRSRSKCALSDVSAPLRSAPRSRPRACCRSKPAKDAARPPDRFQSDRNGSVSKGFLGSYITESVGAIPRRILPPGSWPQSVYLRRRKVFRRTRAADSQPPAQYP